MKVRIAFVLFVCLISASITGAQSTTFLNAIDAPQPGARVPSDAFFIGGWAFDCTTGEHPAIAVPALYNLDRQEWWRFETWWQRDHLYRPDVYNAYRAFCPKVHPYEGWELYVIPQPPPGRYRVWVMWDKNSYFVDVTITN